VIGSVHCSMAAAGIGWQAQSGNCVLPATVRDTDTARWRRTHCMHLMQDLPTIDLASHVMHAVPSLLGRTGDESTRWARFKPAPDGTAFAYQFTPGQVRNSTCWLTCGKRGGSSCKDTVQCSLCILHTTWHVLAQGRSRRRSRGQLCQWQPAGCLLSALRCVFSMAAPASLPSLRLRHMQQRKVFLCGHVGCAVPWTGAQLG
jgi:hypothetical protein